MIATIHTHACDASELSQQRHCKQNPLALAFAHSCFIPMYNARFILWPPSLSSPIRKKLLNGQMPEMRSQPLKQLLCLATQSQRFYDLTRVNITTYLVSIVQFNTASNRLTGWWEVGIRFIKHHRRCLFPGIKSPPDNFHVCSVLIDLSRFPCGRIHRTLNSCSDPGVLIGD